MEEILKKLFVNGNNNLMVQFFRYAVVGGVATVADFSIFHFGTNSLHIHHILANTLSFIIGLLVNYFLSRHWVFNKGGLNFPKDFFVFSIIGVLGLLLSNLILYGLIDLRILYRILFFGNDKLIKDAAKLIATFIVLFWNFIARKKIVFKDT